MNLKGKDTMESENRIRNEISRLVKLYTDTKYKKIDFIPGVTNIPNSGKVIGFEELDMIIDSALDGWLTSGRFNEEFEKKLSLYLGVKYVMTTNSGSSANLLAFTALTSESLNERAIKEGDEVITVAAGFPTTINPIIQNRAIPVFVDIDRNTHNIDVKQLEDAISNKTKAVMIAHSLGNPFNIKAVMDFCKKYNLWLIEDNCDALGSVYNGQLTGTFGDIATLSFYPAHHITMGEGGAVFTNNHKLKKAIESYRDWGRDCYCKTGFDNTCNKRFDWKLGGLPYGYDHKFIYSHMGYNLKITDMQAACGLAQLNKLKKFIDQRKDNFKFISERLESCKEFIAAPQATENSVPSWFGYPITLKESSPIKRVELTKYLDQHKIGTRMLFAGNITKQPYMKNIKYRIVNNLDNTDYIMNNTFWIGLYPGLSNEMLEYSCSQIEAILGVKF